MLYDYEKNLKDLKKRDFGAILGNINTTPMQWGFINIRDLIRCADNGESIKVMSMEGVKPEEVVYGYDKENTVIAEFDSLEKMLDAGWRLD